jgi:pimeloyl-ACP methyl ester carboxylesterase
MLARLRLGAGPQRMTGVRYVENDGFTPCHDKEALNSIVVHRRPDAGHTALVILVHGLGGSRYGTWGNTPRFLYDDVTLHADIGLCDYASGRRRIRPARSVHFPFLAEVVADQIRDAVREKGYQHVVLVGHSMGGLLCMAVIKHFIDVGAESSDGDPVAVNHIAGLFLLASPKAGSRHASLPFTLLSSDARVLKVHNKFLGDLMSTFENRVANSGSDSGQGRILIPTYALVAGRDRWVDQMSVEAGIKDDHLKRVVGSHTSVVKPESPNDEAYQWLAGRVQDCLRQAQARAAMRQLPLKQEETTATTVDGGLAVSTFVEQAARELPRGTKIIIELPPTPEERTP